MDISMILSGLALLAATANLILTFYEKKRNQKRNAASLHYTQNECNSVALASAAYTDEEIKKFRSEIPEWEAGLWEELNRRFDDINGKLEAFGEKWDESDKSFEEISETLAAFEEVIPGIKKNVTDLMQGVVPDYNEAVRAKDAVDNLSQYISNMLNYDPLEEARKARHRRRSGGEVE